MACSECGIPLGIRPRVKGLCGACHAATRTDVSKGSSPPRRPKEASFIQIEQAEERIADEADSMGRDMHRALQWLHEGGLNPTEVFE